MYIHFHIFQFFFYLLKQYMALIDIIQLGYLFNFLVLEASIKQIKLKCYLKVVSMIFV